MRHPVPVWPFVVRYGVSASRRRRDVAGALDLDLQPRRGLRARLGQVHQVVGGDRQPLRELVVAHLADDEQQLVFLQQRALAVVQLGEHHQLELRRAVVEHHDAHAAAPRVLAARGDDDAGELDEVARLLHLGERRGREAARLRGVLGEQVPREVVAERHLLVRQLVARAPARRLHVLDVALGAVGRAEQARLAGRRGLVLRRLDRAADRREQRGSVVEQAVERAGAHERLDHAPVDHVLVDPRARGRTGPCTARRPRARRGSPRSRPAPCP